MHELFAKLLAQATGPDEAVDLDRLGALVGKALQDADEDRRRVADSMAATLAALDQVSRGLEKTVQMRTSELRQRELELRIQNDRFEAAINNMSQGLMMFDAQGRVVVCNQRFLDMYGLPPDSVRPGSSIADILRARLKAGTFSGDPEAWGSHLVEAYASGSLGNRTLDLPDGRTISISSRTIPESGWVATHEDITERRRAEQKIAHMAHHDALTDLPNRLMLREWIEQALKHLDDGRSLAVHYIDLDHFKTVNDTLGHSVGDDLLLAVAGRLRRSVRENEMVARIGGDEFAVVQTGVTSRSDAATLANRIRQTINAPYNLHGHVAIVDASIGIALAPADGRDPHVLMKNADLALYRAKGDGRGAYRYFEPQMDTRLQERRALELALRRALPNGEFELHYQPVVDLADDTVTSCEALLRWRHPERGLIGPDEFVQVAEEIGLIVPLGEWVIHNALADASGWPESVKVSVNLSPMQIEDRNVLASITGALAAAGLAPGRLAVEITEATLMRNSEATLALLHRLRELGIEIALDDFGAGYSSLNYLRSFSFDRVKIDRSFVKSLDGGEDSAVIVRAITGLASSLNITTTAEGVETEAQREQVRALGCREMQGFLFSRPLPPAGLRALFAGGRAAVRSAA